MSLRSGAKSCGELLRRCGENSGDDVCDIDWYPGPRGLGPGTKLNFSALLLFWFTDRPTTPMTPTPSGLSDCCERLCAHIICAARGKSPRHPFSQRRMLARLRIRCLRPVRTAASHHNASSRFGALRGAQACARTRHAEQPECSSHPFILPAPRPSKGHLLGGHRVSHFQK